MLMFYTAVVWPWQGLQMLTMLMAVAAVELADQHNDSLRLEPAAVAHHHGMRIEPASMADHHEPASKEG